jgi:hypothetical protein
LALPFSFLIGFIKKVLYEPFFFEEMVKITKNTKKGESNSLNSKSKREHLFQWMFSFEVFETLTRVSPSDTFDLYFLIVDKLTSPFLRNTSILQHSHTPLPSPKLNILDEDPRFFDIDSNLLNQFALQLYESPDFTGHMFLLLLATFLSLQVDTEYLEK